MASSGVEGTVPQRAPSSLSCDGSQKSRQGWQAPRSTAAVGGGGGNPQLFSLNNTQLLCCEKKVWLEKVWVFLKPKSGTGVSSPVGCLHLWTTDCHPEHCQSCVCQLLPSTLVWASRGPWFSVPGDVLLCLTWLSGTVSADVYQHQGVLFSDPEVWLLFKSFKPVFHFHFPVYLKSGRCISVDCIAYSFCWKLPVNKHTCLVRLCCKLTFHKIHCWYASWCVFDKGDKIKLKIKEWPFISTLSIVSVSVQV